MASHNDAWLICLAPLFFFFVQGKTMAQFLLRCKTGTEANTLLSNLEKYKKGA